MKRRLRVPASLRAREHPGQVPGPPYPARHALASAFADDDLQVRARLGIAHIRPTELARLVGLKAGAFD